MIPKIVTSNTITYEVSKLITPVIVPAVVPAVVPVVVPEVLEQINLDMINAHLDDLDNPHEVTKAQVGLPNCPDDAQKNSDITKSEIEAKLTGEITSHTHAGGSGGLSQSQVFARGLGC